MASASANAHASVAAQPQKQQVRQHQTTLEKYAKLVFVAFYISQQLLLLVLGVGACGLGACDKQAAPHVLFSMVAAALAGGGACVYYIGHLSGCGACLGRPQRNFGLLGSASVAFGLALAAVLLMTVAFDEGASPLLEDVPLVVGGSVPSELLAWMGAALVTSHTVCVFLYEKWYAATGIDVYRMVLLRPLSVLTLNLYVLDMVQTLHEAGVDVLLVSTDKQDTADTAKAYRLSLGPCTCGEAAPKPPGAPSGAKAEGPAAFKCTSAACLPDTGVRRCLCVYDEDGRELKRLGVAREQPNPLVSWRSLLCTLCGGGHSEPVACPSVFVLDAQHRLVWRYVAADYRVWPDAAELAAAIAHTLDIPQLLADDVPAPVTHTVQSVDDSQAADSKALAQSPMRSEVVLP